MLRKLHNKITRLLDSITGKIILIMVLSILPLNILVIISTGQAINVVQEQAMASIENAANLYIHELDSRIFSINYYFYDLAENDADFISLTMQKGDDAYILSKALVSKKYQDNIETAASADAYFFYSQELKDFLIITSSRLPVSDNTRAGVIRNELQEWLLAADLSELERWNLIEVNEGKWLLRVFEVNNFYYGALISLDNISHKIMGAVDFQRLQVNMSVGSDPADSNGYLAATSSSDRIDFSLRLSVPRRDVIMSLPLLQWIGIVLAFAFLTLIPLLYFVMNRILLRPLGKIRDALLHIKANDNDYRINSYKYSEEFRVINQSFNEMADNIEHLKIENYEKEMSRQKMELRNLQLQIRPHFLLNMFKLIYGLAQIQEYQSIQKLTLYLSNYFRYIFRSEKELESFEQEYNLIREYLDVSKIRYPNRFSIEYRIDEAVFNLEVPPLLLHNFVENVINHALLPDKTVNIVLSAHYKNGWVELIVSDDGAGMEPDVAQYINSGQFSASDTKQVHVGILNSYQRIRHFYGEESVLHVASAPGKGTCVTIRFPYKIKEESLL